MRKAVRSIGRLAIKIEESADKCTEALLGLVGMKINYVLQEAIVVIKDIFRRYPNRYEAIIVNLCENLDSLDEPDAKAAIIWIIGQYSDRIENANDLLEDFLFTFLEDSIEVSRRKDDRLHHLRRCSGTACIIDRHRQIVHQATDRRAGDGAKGPQASHRRGRQS